MNEKKTVWDFIDEYLPPAASIYGKLRQQTTGVDPFATKKEDELPVEDIKVQQPQPKSNKTLLIVGGVIVLGIATYFLTQKFRRGQANAK